MAVPHSRELCLKEAVGAYEHKVRKICGQIDSELRGRGIGSLSTSPFEMGVWDSVGEITATVIECDKASASRQLARIREAGTVSERSPFHTENVDLLKKCIADTIQKIPTLLKSARRLMPGNYTNRNRLYAEREQQRIELEYQALEDEFRKDIDAVIQARRQSLPEPTISESPTVTSGAPPMSGNQAGSDKPRWLQVGSPPNGWHSKRICGLLKQLAEWEGTSQNTLKAHNPKGVRWWIIECGGTDDETGWPTPYAIYYPSEAKFLDANKRRREEIDAMKREENVKKRKKLEAVPRKRGGK